MAKIAVSAVVNNNEAAARIQENIDTAQAAVREQAYQVATRQRDHDFENWLQAEREVLWIPPCELMEQNGDYRIRAAVPGLEANQLSLTAMPDAIVIEATRLTNPVKNEKPVFSEFNPNGILRRVDLPGEIDATAVRAKLERGILEIVAPKRGAAKKAAKPRKPAAAKTQTPAKKSAAPRKTSRRKKTA